jgi:hypothetical protein
VAEVARRLRLSPLFFPGGRRAKAPFSSGKPNKASSKQSCAFEGCLFERRKTLMERIAEGVPSVSRAEANRGMHSLVISSPQEATKPTVAVIRAEAHLPAEVDILSFVGPLSSSLASSFSCRS